MALPVTITGIIATIPIAGPFKSSAGNFYFIGASSADSTKIRAYKATDPTSSWSNVGTDPAITNAVTVDWVSVWQDGNTLHVGTASTPSTSTNSDYYYKTFDMSSDAWTSMNEAIATGVAVNAAAGYKRGISVCKRSSSGEIVAVCQSTYTYMSTLYNNVKFSRRTGTNTWTSLTDLFLDNLDLWGGRCLPDPQSDWVLLSFYRQTWGKYSTPLLVDNSLGTGNTLQSSYVVTHPSVPYSYTIWNDAGTSRMLVMQRGNNAGWVMQGRAVVADTVSWTIVTNQWTTPIAPIRVFNDGTNSGTSDAWVIYRSTSDSDLYVRQSTDDGATWGSETNAMTASVAEGAAMSIDADRTGCIQRGNMLLPYFINDNGTLKYNEYTVRTISNEVNLSGDNLAVSAPVETASPLTTIYAFTGNDLAVSAPVLDIATAAITSPLSAANLAVGVPVIDAAAFVQHCVLSAAALAVGPPVEEAAPLTTRYAFGGNNLAVAAPVLVAATAAITVPLAAANLAVSAPVLVSAAIVATSALSAAALAVSAPVITAATIAGGYTHTLSAEVLAVAAPVLTPAEVSAFTPVTVVLTQYAIDFGLDTFYDADQILVCSDEPTDYASALTYKLGGKTFGAGATFSLPQPGSPAGRKVTSAEITDGNITANGTVVCWAAIDSTQSWLLAQGILADGIPVTSGQGFTLDSFDVHLTG